MYVWCINMNSITLKTEDYCIEIVINDECEGPTWIRLYNEFLCAMKGLGYNSEDFDDMRIEE